MEWGRDRVYGTELSMVLNHKCWYWYGKQDEEFSKLYAKLWGEYHNWVLDNWKGEDLKYFCFRVVGQLAKNKINHKYYDTKLFTNQITCAKLAILLGGKDA